MTFQQLMNGGAAFVAAAAIVSPAAAQVAYDRDHNKSVQQRAYDEHRPTGMRAGGFLAFPQLDLGVEFNDNIFAAAANETDDTIFVASPSLSLESQWSVHRLNLFAGAVTRTFMDSDDDNVFDWRVGADGQIDINRDMYLTGRLYAGEATESRFSGNGPAALIEPIEYSYTEAGATFVRNVNRIRGTLGVDFANYDFDDGRLPGNVVFEQDDRDHDYMATTGRLDYALSPDTAVFGAVTYRTREYDVNTFNRDSEGWRYLVGANFDLTATIRGEVGVGYSSTSYDNPALSDTDGLALVGRMEWFITQLTTITLDGLRDTVESDIGGTAAIERTTAGIRVDHELRRDVILNGEAYYDKDEYEGIDRDDDRTRYQVGADWYVNRLVTAGVAFQRFSQDSSGLAADRDFDVNQVMFKISLRR